MKNIIKASLLAATVLLRTSAFAVNKTSSFAVTTTINPACTINANALAFGVYDPLGVNASAPLTGSTTISLQCVDELTGTLSLDEGLYKAAGSSPVTPLRRMQCADLDGSFLTYGLYQDAALSQVWGTSSSTMNITGDGAAHSITVYGKVDPGQVEEDESYSDTVVATVSY